MAIIADDDFQSYALGSNPPFVYYQNANTAGTTVVIASGAGTNPIGQFGQSKVLFLGPAGVQFPQLPTITLAQALAGVTYANSGVPTYTDATIFFGTQTSGSGFSQQGFLLSINNNINPYNGATLLRLDINQDGSFSFVSPDGRWATSDFALLPEKWYFLQLNVSFGSSGGFVTVTATLAANGQVVLTGTHTTNQSTSPFPTLYWNNLVWGPVGNNGGYLANTTIYDTIQTIGNVPHPGVPNALVSQGVIELIKHPTTTPPLVVSCPLGSATIGVPYDSFVGVSGGQSPYTFAVTVGALPTGLVLNASTGEITGTPTTSGTFTYTITVTDFFGTITSTSCSILVAGLANCSERFGPKLYFWEPSFLDRPEDIEMRATDWENAGLVGAKFCQGFTLHADTQGVDKQITIQGDGASIQTYTINHNGEEIKPYVFKPAAVASLLRVISPDTVDWRFFGIKYIWEPLPESVTYYKTQGTTHDLPGYQFLKDGYIALISNADVALTINVDGTDFVYTIPSTGGAYKKNYIIFGINGTTGQTLKGKLYTYELRSTDSTKGFRLFQKDSEVFVHAWGGGPYLSKQPFGAISRLYGARI